MSNALYKVPSLTERADFRAYIAQHRVALQLAHGMTWHGRRRASNGCHSSSGNEWRISPVSSSPTSVGTTSSVGTHGSMGETSIRHSPSTSTSHLECIAIFLPMHFPPTPSQPTSCLASSGSSLCQRSTPFPSPLPWRAGGIETICLTQFLGVGTPLLEGAACGEQGAAPVAAVRVPFPLAPQEEGEACTPPPPTSRRRLIRRRRGGS
jgi:hypothetical protein